LSKNIEQQKIQRIELTNNQKRTLDILKNRRRVAISGGAGTGKTILAIEKAKRLAQEGFKTLLTCYNRQLADHLSLTCKNVDNLEVMGFHQLCDSHIRKFNAVNPDRDVLQEAEKTYPGKDKWDYQMPGALLFTAENPALQFEAVVCDEGQDFREEYWLPIEFLLKDSKTSPLYVFFDGNQNIYSRVQSFPIEDKNTFPLTDNCRNTTQIHRLAYKFYKGEWVDPPKNPGAEIRQIASTSLQNQAKKIAMEITNLIANENMSPGDISVLILYPRGKNNKSDLLISEPLPGSANWLVERFQGEDEVLIDTVSRYKGLESEIVFLWGIDDIDLFPESDLLYVGISRAKSVLYLVGSNESWANIHRM
jgi:superfamily I DNA/RNA helicase